MNTPTVSQDNDRSMAVLISFLFHAAFLAILIFWKIYAPDKPTETPAIVLDWGGGGDDAALGTPDIGQGNEKAAEGQQMEEPKSKEETPDPAPKPTPTPPAPSNPQTSKSNAKVEVPKNTPTTTDPEAAAVKRAKEESAKKEREVEDAKRKQREADAAVEREKERAKQAEADKKRKDQEEYNKKKGKYGDLLGGGDGDGKGNTGKKGNQGNPNGDPDGDNPFGKEKGKGGGTGGGDGTGDGSSVGGGLGGREVKYRPKIKDNSQKTGRVRIQVCVDGTGKVVSASPTQSGSTTTDTDLRKLAVDAAFKYKFASNGAEKECGWIDFNFTLQ